MYKLFLDKPTEFECEVSVKNANLKNSTARIVVETDNLDLIFKGKIDEGKCVVPIRKLKGLLTESDKGNIHLEIIVDDTFFTPWTEQFVVEEHTSVKVQVKEQIETNNKPILEVVVKKPVISPAAKDLLKLCEGFDININNYKTNKREDFKKVIKEYFKINQTLIKKTNSILNEVISVLK